MCLRARDSGCCEQLSGVTEMLAWDKAPRTQPKVELLQRMPHHGSRYAAGEQLRPRRYGARFPNHPVAGVGGQRWHSSTSDASLAWSSCLLSRLNLHFVQCHQFMRKMLVNFFETEWYKYNRGGDRGGLRLCLFGCLGRMQVQLHQAKWPTACNA